MKIRINIPLPGPFSVISGSKPPRRGSPFLGGMFIVVVVIGAIIEIGKAVYHAVF